MSAWNGQYADDGDEHRPCASCGEEHPVGVLDDELCPSCVDEDACEHCGDGDPVPAKGYWRCPVCDAEWNDNDEDDAAITAATQPAPAQVEEE